MTGRRERVAGQSIRGSRIAAAIGVGILVGCIFAFLFPNGFLGFDPPQEHQSAKSAVQEYTNYYSHVKELTFSDSKEYTDYYSHVRELTFSDSKEYTNYYSHVRELTFSDSKEYTDYYSHVRELTLSDSKEPGGLFLQKQWEREIEENQEEKDKFTNSHP